MLRGPRKVLCELHPQQHVPPAALCGMSAYRTLLLAADSPAPQMIHHSNVQAIQVLNGLYKLIQPKHKQKTVCALKWPNRESN